MAITEPDLITSDILEVYQSNISAIKHQLGKPVTVIWEESSVGCPNCYQDKSLKASTGKYKSGGPIAFTVPPCPYCAGKGRISTEGSIALSGNVYYTSINGYQPEPGSIGINQVDSVSFLISECYVPSGSLYSGKLVFDVCKYLEFLGHVWIVDGKPEPSGLGNDPFVIEVKVKHSNKV